MAREQKLAVWEEGHLQESTRGQERVKMAEVVSAEKKQVLPGYEDGKPSPCLQSDSTMTLKMYKETHHFVQMSTLFKSKIEF